MGMLVYKPTTSKLIDIVSKLFFLQHKIEKSRLSLVKVIFGFNKISIRLFSGCMGIRRPHATDLSFTSDFLISCCCWIASWIKLDLYTLSVL